MKKSITRKCLVISVIMIFIGVAVAPTINFNTVKASTDDGLIEVTTQACGIKGYEDTTVKLTREQYKNLEQYLVEFRAQINESSTWEETAILFRQAVVTLYDYDLLPKNMGIDDAQRLVTRGFQEPRLMSRSASLNRNKQLSNDSNFLCLLTGITTRTSIIGIPELGIAALIYLMFFPYFIEQIISEEPHRMEQILLKLRNLTSSIQRLSSRRIIQAGTIVFGTSKDEYIPPEFRFLPAYGWIDTQGLFGKKSWNGTFFGGIRTLQGFEFRSFSYYIGATGFVGLTVNKGDGKKFFLGSAVRCDVNYFEY